MIKNSNSILPWLTLRSVGWSTGMSRSYGCSVGVGPSRHPPTHLRTRSRLHRTPSRNRWRVRRNRWKDQRNRCCDRRTRLVVHCTRGQGLCTRFGTGTCHRVQWRGPRPWRRLSRCSRWSLTRTLQYTKCYVALRVWCTRFGTYINTVIVLMSAYASYIPSFLRHFLHQMYNGDVNVKWRRKILLNYATKKHYLNSTL